uniref:SWIM-type domain-containing protein n=1 Tax=Fagus sylvatica TaxID=28930 RepID=A0A2N9HBQ1_FAGSY
MDTSGYAKAGTSRNTTYDAVSVNPTDERRAIHYTKDDISRMTFKTVTKWEEWYKHYSFLMGFGLRREDIRTDRNGEVIARKWVCSKEGFKRTTSNEEDGSQRQERSITRCGCKAFLRVKLDKTSNTWVVANLELTHNHALTDTHQRFFIPAHRTIAEGEKAEIQSLYQTGIKQSQMYEHLAHQAGGYNRLPFTKKDFYNYTYAYRLVANEDGHLECLFWSDSTSRLDYACFGDVTIVFGSGLLNVETEEAYTWLLQAFHDAMNNKSPVSVVTDGDRAMRNAINTVFPNANHRLCSWHLARNAKQHIKNSAALQAFHKLMNDIQTRDQFEEKWNSMIEDFHLQENEWLRKMHTDRAMWAEAYLRGKFWAEIRSTQRCEGTHAYMKRSLEEKASLVDFIKQFHKKLDGMRHSESQEDYITQQKKPPSAWDTRWEVTFDATSVSIRCTCLEFETVGLPCEHTFHIMKVARLKEIPQNLISLRWTKIAKSNSRPTYYSLHDPNDVTEVVRYGALTSRCNNLCYIASRSDEGYRQFNAGLDMLTQQMHHLHASDLSYNDEDINRSSSRADILKDPRVAHTKGGQKADKGKEIKKRKCALCKEEGHTKRTCPLSNINMMDNNSQISSPTIQFASEEDMSFNPAVYNSSCYDTSVCATMMENPSYTTATRCTVYNSISYDTSVYATMMENPSYTTATDAQGYTSTYTSSNPNTEQDKFYNWL